MVRKSKTARGAANDSDVSVSVNEKILKEAHDLYTKKGGMLDMAEALGVEMLAPRKKVSILIVGNHSSGKSSFINWYCGEHLLKTSVAMETQGFEFVTSGKKEELLQGSATLELFKQYEGMREFPGLVETLRTHISVSKERKFPMLILIDSPGLVDGQMVYPFEVSDAILWVAQKVDLVFVFMDPQGQALTSRTMDIVKHLSETCPEKVRYYVTKIDTVRSEEDRQKVLIQTVQNLSQHIKHRTALSLPTIYIPSEENEKCGISNSIEQVCTDIEKTISSSVQTTLNTIEADCKKILKAIEKKKTEDDAKRGHNMKARLRGVFLTIISFVVLLFVLAFQAAKHDLLSLFAFGFENTAPLMIVSQLSERVSDDSHFYISAVGAGLCLVLFVVAQLLWRTEKTLSTKDYKLFGQYNEFVHKHVLPAKQDFYDTYFAQTLQKEDF